MPKGCTYCFNRLRLSFLSLLLVIFFCGAYSLPVCSQSTDTLAIFGLESQWDSLQTLSSLSEEDSSLQESIIEQLIFYYQDKDSIRFKKYSTAKKSLPYSYILPITLPKQINQSVNISHRIGIWKDSLDGKSNIQQVAFGNTLFEGNSVVLPEMEIGAYYWLTITLLGNAERDETIALQVGSVYQRWSEAQMYESVSEGAFRIEYGGNSLTPEQKSVQQWRDYFLVEVPSDGKVQLFFKVHSKEKRFHPSAIKLYLTDADTIPMGTEEFTYAQGIFQGILWVMAFYNLLLFFIIGDRLYLYYVLMILGIQLNVFYYYRYIYFLFPTANLAIRSLVLLSHLLMIGGGLLFLGRFLNIEKLLPKWMPVIRTIIIILTILVAAYVSINLFSSTPTWEASFATYASYFSQLAVIVLGVIASILGLILGILALRKGNSAALYYLIATTAFLIGGVFYALSYLFNTGGAMVTYLFQGGVVIQLVFYALGIGYQVNRLEREKSDALAENLELQKETTALLEKKVKQRTIEIEQQKEEIEAINVNLIEQKSLIEKRNNDITSSINYARRIQDAVLPDLRALKQSVPECFVLYKPRDIVSGDFYWFTQKNDKVVLAVSDCTGHGVPGAFMSILGDSYLNQIVNLQGITDADTILSRLHTQIRKALRQSSTENKDGMDIAICILDLTEKTITFAGAKRPLLFIQDDKLSEIKGDKISVGGYHTKTEHQYTSHVIKVEEPTSFYIFSDGYVDQFGGDENRKFMLKRFKNLLLDIHQEPMITQRKRLSQEFSDWKGRNKQIDDVLVIGFKMS